MKTMMAPSICWFYLELFFITVFSSCINGALKITPENVAKFLNESVDFQCGTDIQNGGVMWTHTKVNSFSPVEIYGGGVLQEDMKSRYRVESTKSEFEILLIIDRVDFSYSGTYSCSDGNGAVNKELIVIESGSDTCNVSKHGSGYNIECQMRYSGNLEPSNPACTDDSGVPHTPESFPIPMDGSSSLVKFNFSGVPELFKQMSCDVTFRPKDNCSATGEACNNATVQIKYSIKETGGTSIPDNTAQIVVGVVVAVVVVVIIGVIVIIIVIVRRKRRQKEADPGSQAEEMDRLSKTK